MVSVEGFELITTPFPHSINETFQSRHIKDSMSFEGIGFLKYSTQNLPIVRVHTTWFKI